MKHSMRLQRLPFNQIKSGVKTIEARLNDDKRSKLQIGDTIEFTAIDDSADRVEVIVNDLLRYDTFADMYEQNNPRLFGGTTADELTESIQRYYSEEEQAKYGVLGIVIQKR